MAEVLPGAGFKASQFSEACSRARCFIRYEGELKQKDHTNHFYISLPALLTMGSVIKVDLLVPALCMNRLSKITDLLQVLWIVITHAQFSIRLASMYELHV